MRLSHFSKFEVGAVVSHDSQSISDKPSGFWVSVDGPYDWEAWCVAEDFRLECLAVLHQVTLAPSARVLFVASPHELDAFHETYSVDGWHIDWRRVARDYQGIIIAPYQWSRRCDGQARWYYTWDCASGCIWDASAISSIEVMSVDRREVAA